MKKRLLIYNICSNEVKEKNQMKYRKKLESRRTKRYASFKSKCTVKHFGRPQIYLINILKCQPYKTIKFESLFFFFLGV